MSEKERNPLKRGRIQGKPLAQKKKALVGEISDPFSVLSDSIATKGRSESPGTNDYIPSEGIEDKTTTVDPVDVSSDYVGEGRGTAEESRDSSARRYSNRPQEGYRSDVKRREPRHRDWKESHSTAESKYGTPASKEAETCSKKCCIKRFFCKVLECLGIRSSRSCQCKTPTKETRSISNANRHSSFQKREGTRNGNRHRDRHHHSKASPRKF
jgi:hypothetical protein